MSSEENPANNSSDPKIDSVDTPSDPNLDRDRASIESSSPIDGELDAPADERVEATAIVSESSNASASGDPVLAEIATSEPENLNSTSTTTVYADSIPPLSPPPIDKNLENLAANGGAIGSLVLGLWCVLGSFITTWSILNGSIGLMMGLWGLTSRKKRVAWLGIVFCVIGIFMSLIQVSELINSYLNQVDENPY